MEWLRQVCRDIRQPTAEMLALMDPAVVSEAKKIGVAGFLRKDQKPETITRALEAIGAGRTAFDPGSSRQPSRRTVPSPAEEMLRKLTPRERQVLQRIVAGQLDAHSRVQAAAIASRGSADDDFRT